MRLKARLLLITAIGLFPAVVLIAANSWWQFLQEKSAAARWASGVAEQLVREQALTLAESERFLNTISYSYETLMTNQVDCQDALRHWLQLSPYFSNLIITSPTSGQICQATELHENAQVIVNQIYVQQAIMNQKLSVGEVLTDQKTHKPFLQVAYPLGLFHKGSRSAIAGELSFDWWQTKLSQMNIPYKASINLLDSRQVVLATNGLLPSQVVSDDSLRIEKQRSLLPNVTTSPQIVISLSTRSYFTIVIENLAGNILFLLFGYLLAIAIIWWGFSNTVLKPTFELLRRSRQYVNDCTSGSSATLDELSGFCEQFDNVLKEQDALKNRLMEQESNLSQAYNRINSLLDNSPFGVVEWDTHLRIQRWSTLCEQIFQMNQNEVEGRQIAQLPVQLKRHLWSIEPFLKLYQNGKDSSKRIEVGYRDEMGSEKVLRWCFSAIYDDSGDLSSILGLFENVTQQAEYQREIEYHARYDSLTGLPNRYSALQLISDRQSKKVEFAVALLDIKGFKLVNDHYGHEYGDMLLVELSERVSGKIQRDESFARWGGNEFIYVLPYIDEERVAKRLEEVITDIAQPILLGTSSYSTQLNCGVALSDRPLESPSELIRFADLAIFFGKKEKNRTINFYQPSMSEIGSAQFETESELRRAISNNEFALVFQPILNTETQTIESAEALVRWNHPQKGLIPPSHFIPVAEDSGLILQIGNWVLDQAVSQLKAWVDEGLEIRDIAVNLSALQINDVNFVANIKNILQRYDLPPQYLTLEVTETSLLASYTDVIAKIGELKALGIKIALDDFGTGYSSLSYLNELPLTKLKIDRSFVARIDEPREPTVLLDAIISIAHNMGLSVVAEGIETLSQYEYLEAKRCEFSQGYYFSPPIDAISFRELLAQKLCKDAPAKNN
ncbi:EAL domain-containing protein [Vibrio nigripulchritudo]|uniref:EAL domain-containing protein n=1 Tax=Vibrio nigripulchritudo TaxID=28173 RepID=UPI002491102A|nr:EAL domain-containing protein [Vibrio nigripulchritudo]BDU36812.1 hypothetical protein TUMSATVNIG2_12810 [Vibrio nigripulchritudo]BDU42522.1 hypothetical protein TUMSATVNIG3_13200 [Vibrio nigripulchritudo]